MSQQGANLTRDKLPARSQNEQENSPAQQNPSLSSELLVNRETYLNTDPGSEISQKNFSFQLEEKQAQINRKQNKIGLQLKQNKVEQQRHQYQSNMETNNKQPWANHKEPEKQGRQEFQKQSVALQQIPKQVIQACQKITQELFNKLQMQQIRRQIQQRLNPLYEQFCKSYENMISDVEIQESINTYSQILVKYWDEEMFFQHFVQNKYLSTLMSKIRQFKYAADIVKAVFGCLQYLLKGLGSESGLVNSKISNREEQFIYLLVMINKQGFITENYKFSEVQDWAYYAHFMKLLVRIINQADKAQEQQLKDLLKLQSHYQSGSHVSQSLTFSPEKTFCKASESRLRSLKSFEFQQIYSKYLTIFFNKKIPQFPLLLKLLYFYKWPDTILQTSVKLCLLQISNHPNRKLQKYFVNFPFVTFYMLYCTKISDNIQRYLALGTLRFASEKQTQKQQILSEQIISDIKFMQDFLKVEQQQSLTNPTLPLLSNSIKSHNIQQHLNMYINTFCYYISRGFYQHLLKYATQQNINGLINGLLLLIKISKMNTILKIKLGFEEMLHKYINCDLLDYLKSKRERLDDKYWMFDQCSDIIREHLDNVLFQEGGKDQEEDRDRVYMMEGDIGSSIRFSVPSQKSKMMSQRVDLVQVMSVSSQVSKSTLPVSNPQKTKKSAPYSSMLFKTMRSFIPTTNSNWVYYEMKKMSEIMGLQIVLNKQIQHLSSTSTSNSYYKNCFLFIIDKIQENNYNGNNNMVLSRKKSLLSRFTSPIRINPLFSSIIGVVNRGSIKHTNSGSSHKSNESGSGSNKKINDDNTEQLIYYYLVVMCSIKDTHTHRDHHHQANRVDKSRMDNINIQEISELLKITKKCRSLMLVGIMYWYIKILDYQLQEKNNDFAMLNEGSRQLEALMRENEKQKEREKNRESGNKEDSYDTKSEINNSIAAEMLQTYMGTMEKLVYYILTEGWEAFIKHVKSIKNIIWNKNNHITPNSKLTADQKDKKTGQCTYEYEDCNKNASTQFYNDIFRDTQCDIVYFIMLRHIFGTRNTHEQLPDDIQNGMDINEKDIISKEIKVPCRLTNSQGDLVYLMMDGQYIKFTTMEDVLITKKPMSVSCFNIYEQDMPNVYYSDGALQQEDEADVFMNSNISNNTSKSPIKSQIKQKVRRTAVFELVDKNINGECFTVHFDELPIREYVAKEIKWRKKATMNIQMCLRTMRFDIEE